MDILVWQTGLHSSVYCVMTFHNTLVLVYIRFGDQSQSHQTVKTQGRVSAAKKAVWRTSVSFTGSANSLFSTLVSLKPLSRFLSNSHIICPPYMRHYVPNLKEIGPVVCKVCVPENCLIFFTFFFFCAPFYKYKFEPTKDTFAVDRFLSNLAHL